MHVKTIKCIILVLFVSSLLVPCLYGSSSPLLNNGAKWRIGYYEGGSFSDYTDTMRTFIQGLMESGWIVQQTIPQYMGNVPKPYVNWLIKNNGPYLEFRAEDCYSANWDESKRADIRKELLNKLRSNSLDLVIAMGTWAGQDLANNQHSVPVLVMSTSDPIGAGIIKSVSDSGLKHVTARVDPSRYMRQLRMFHRIVGFKTLGVAFENSEDGRIYSAINEVEKIAEERGFDTYFCELLDTTTEDEVAKQGCLNCFQQLAENSDAVYMTALNCADRNHEEIASILRDARVPSFSMMGSKFVEKGLMLSISNDSGYEALGSYQAMKFGAILNGTSPGALEQLFEDPLDIAVNMKTVRAIGFAIPESILKVAAEIYED